MPDTPQPDARPYVVAALALAGIGLVLIAVGAALDSDAVLVAAAVAVAAALVPILWWRAVLIQDWKDRSPGA